MNSRGLLAAGILAAWGAGLGMLAQRQFSRTALDHLAESAIRVAPGASYYTLEASQRSAGFASVTTDTITDGLQFLEYAVRDDSVDGTRSVRLVQTVASRGLVVRQIDVTAGRQQLARLRVSGDSTAVLYVGSDSSVHTFAPPLLPAGLIPMAMALGEDREIGTERNWTVFDPERLVLRPMTARFAADTTFIVVDSAAFDARTGRWLGAHADSVRAWRVVDATRGDGGLDVWVDEQGHLVRSRWMGLAASRTAYEIAFENWRASRAGTMPVAENVSAPDDVSPSRLQSITFVATGLPFSRLQATDARQRLTGDTVHIELPKAEGQLNPGYWLPPHREVRTRFVRQLQAEPGVETDHPYVVALARSIRRREPDPWQATQLLLTWISDSVRLESTLALPGAQAALRSRAGDAAQHVLAFTALARASGIPTRMVAGVVRSGDAWVARPWAEVWVREAWLPVDPSTGELPASASHFRLVVSPPGVLPELERLTERASLPVIRETPLPSRTRPSR